MTYLSQSDADSIITAQEFSKLTAITKKNQLTIRCQQGEQYSRGAGYNLAGDNFTSSIAYATALYATMCFSQDTIQENIDQFKILLMNNCATSGGETYYYKQGGDTYTTLGKCGSLGSSAQLITCWPINNRANNLARMVVERILSNVGLN